MPDPATPTRSRLRSLAVWAPVALAIMALPVGVFAVVLTVYHHLARPGAQTPSTVRLHVIGQALHAYAQDHGGAYPKSLADLAAAQHLTPDLPTCPSDAPGGPFSYNYHGLEHGILLSEQTATNGTVMVDEPLAANAGRGSHLLYADGSDVWVATPNLQAELDRGRPPERPPE